MLLQSRPTRDKNCTGHTEEDYHTRTAEERPLKFTQRTEPESVLLEDSTDSVHEKDWGIYARAPLEIAVCICVNKFWPFSTILTNPFFINPRNTDC